MQESTFDTGNVTINYAIGEPAGPPLVLLHGGSARWQNFDAILPQLGAHWQIYAPDLRGHGKSGWTPGQYRLQDYTNDLIVWLEQCVSEPAHIFGHSLGGMIALMVAAQAPALVRSVVVGDAPLSSKSWQSVLETDRERLIAMRDLAGGAVPLDQLEEMLKNAPLMLPGRAAPITLREALGEDSPYFPGMALNLAQHDPNMLSMLLDAFEDVATGYEPEAILPQIRCPALLLQGDPAAGGLLSDDEIRRALSLLRSPQHVQLRGIGHALYNEQAAPVLDALTAFLSTH
ncbi:MAG: alpha/beta hydrolase [Chloroflexi bacterium]|nr:alpha/beta hydrolase [Chloroflexota bacterium]